MDVCMYGYMDAWTSSACIRHDLRSRVGLRGSPKNEILIDREQRGAPSIFFYKFNANLQNLGLVLFMSHMAADSSHS